MALDPRLFGTHNVFRNDDLGSKQIPRMQMQCLEKGLALNGNPSSAVKHRQCKQ